MATLVLLLVTTQVIFFVQASMAELEVMVTMLTVLSLYYYSQDYFMLASLTLSLLFLTKESGLVFGLVIGVHAFASLFRKSEPLKQRIFRVTAVSVSLLPVGIFFLLQKQKEGWFIFPLHSSLINTGWDHMYYFFRLCIDRTFRGGDGNHLLFAAVILLSAVPAIKYKNIRYLFLLLPATIVFIITNKWITEHTGDVLWVVLFALVFFAAFHSLLLFNTAMSKPARRFVILLGCCFGAYLCFSSISVLTFRYLLVEIVLSLIFLALCIDTFAVAAGEHLYYLGIAGILIAGIWAFYSDKGNDDTDLEAFHAMKVQKDIVAYLERADAYDKEVTTGFFWEEVHLIDTAQGFLNSPRIFTKPNWDTAGPNTDYAVFDNICYSSTYSRMVMNPAFHLVYRTEIGRSWAEIYKRK